MAGSVSSPYFCEYEVILRYLLKFFVSLWIKEFSWKINELEISSALPDVSCVGVVKVKRSRASFCRMWRRSSLAV